MQITCLIKCLPCSQHKYRIHLLSKYSLTTYYILVILLGAGDTKINRTHPISKRVHSIVDILFYFLAKKREGDAEGLKYQSQFVVFKLKLELL